MKQKDRLFIERKALFQQQQIGDSKDVYSGTYARDPSKPTQVQKTWVLSQVSQFCLHEQGRTLEALTVQVLPVALKILSRSVSTDVERIVELLQTASLQCDYVCRFYGVSQIDACDCLVTKLYKQSLQAELDATSGTTQLSYLSSLCVWPWC